MLSKTSSITENYLEKSKVLKSSTAFMYPLPMKRRDCHTSSNSWLPTALSVSLLDFHLSYGSANDMLSKLRIPKPAEYFSKASVDGIALSTCFVLKSVASDFESIISEAVLDKSWVDVSVCIQKQSI